MALTPTEAGEAAAGPDTGAGAAYPHLAAWLASRRPIEQTLIGVQPWRLDLSSPLARARAHLDMWLVDHGVFRSVWTGLHQLSPRMWRSNQPGPARIAAAAALGIRTIVNLRGARPCGTYALEEEACRRHGIALVNFSVGSREAPRREALHGARELFQAIAYPALMHCKSGADRVGLMSVFYLFVHEGRPLAEALGQLSLRFGHVRQGKTGVLDHFYETYAAAHAASGIGFWEWVERDYDPIAMTRDFKARGWGNLLVDGILRRE